MHQAPITARFVGLISAAHQASCTQQNRQMHQTPITARFVGLISAAHQASCTQQNRQMHQAPITARFVGLISAAPSGVVQAAKPPNAPGTYHRTLRRPDKRSASGIVHAAEPPDGGFALSGLQMHQASITARFVGLISAAPSGILQAAEPPDAGTTCP
ncbi:hypothetical protein MXL54_19600 [Enterobacteriaceae bacterium G50]|nr:hypothetical protein [Enterobacteriaceae bacterium G50]